MALSLITPASDLGLLSIAELRAAVGLAAGDTSRDPELTVLGLRVAGLISAFCAVAPAGVAPPTLRYEVVEDVFRLTGYVGKQILSRRWVTSIVAVTLDGDDVDTDLLAVEGPAGILYRLDADDRHVCWGPGKLVVRYGAGFAAVPDDLKACAVDLVRQMDSQGQRDPLLRAESADGIGRQEYQIASGMAMEGGIPSDIAGRLSRYRNWTL